MGAIDLDVPLPGTGGGKGAAFDWAEGKKDEVEFSPAIDEAASDGNRRVGIVHNHPGSSMPPKSTLVKAVDLLAEDARRIGMDLSTLRDLASSASTGARPRGRTSGCAAIYPDINCDPQESRHTALSPYLFDAGGLSDPHRVVREQSAPINGMGRLISASQPIDGGNCIFDAAERAELLEAEPVVAILL